MGRICRKEGFKSGMKERVGDEKLMIISVIVNDHITFYSFAAANHVPNDRVV